MYERPISIAYLFSRVENRSGYELQSLPEERQANSLICTRFYSDTFGTETLLKPAASL